MNTNELLERLIEALGKISDNLEELTEAINNSEIGIDTKMEKEIYK